MDIVKPGVNAGQDLASLYGRRTETGEAGKANLNSGECQAKSSGSCGAAAAPMLSISAEAREKAERQEALQLARDHYAELPAIRREVIQMVRERIASGYYDSESVQTELVERLGEVLRRT